MMKKSAGKIWALLLCAALMVSVINPAAYADSGNTPEAAIHDQEADLDGQPAESVSEEAKTEADASGETKDKEPETVEEDAPQTQAEEEASLEIKVTSGEGAYDKDKNTYTFKCEMPEITVTGKELKSVTIKGKHMSKETAPEGFKPGSNSFTFTPDFGEDDSTLSFEIKAIDGADDETDVKIVISHALDGAECVGEGYIAADYHRLKCKDCGETVSVKHAPGSEVSAKDGENHWFACTYPGCKAQVSAAHELDETVWAHDGDQHWRVCKVCQEPVENSREAHTPTADDDCTTDIDCAVCGAVAVKGAEKHDFATDWAGDGEKHWHACQNKDCQVRDGEKSHSPAEDDGDCTTGALCTVCGLTYTEAQEEHSWGEEWLSSKKGHWHACENEGCEQTSKRVAHESPEDDEDCTTAELCTVCGYVLTKAQKAHKLVWRSDANGHWQECVNEGCAYAAAPEAHQAGEDDKDCTTAELCTVCEWEITAAKEHSLSKEWSSNEKKHWHECENEGCEVRLDKAAHGGEDDGDCRTALKCADCGYELLAAKKEHNYDDNWMSSVFGHWHACKNKNCTAKTDKGDHSYVDGKCSVCGAAEPTTIYKNPKTGDEANLGLWAAGMGLSALMAAVLFILWKRRKECP